MIEFAPVLPCSLHSPLEHSPQPLWLQVLVLWKTILPRSRVRGMVSARFKNITLKLLPLCGPVPNRPWPIAVCGREVGDPCSRGALVFTTGVSLECLHLYSLFSASSTCSALRTRAACSLSGLVSTNTCLVSWFQL